MKIILAALLWAFTSMSVQVMAYPMLPNPPLPGGADRHGAPPAGYLYDKYNNLMGVSNNRGVDTFFNINQSSPIPPVVASGFGSSPVLTGYSNAAFSVKVGSGGAANGALTLPLTAAGWACQASDITSYATILVRESAQTTASATFTSYSASAPGTPANMNANDVIVFQCTAF